MAKCLSFCRTLPGGRVPTKPEAPYGRTAREDPPTCMANDLDVQKVCLVLQHTGHTRATTTKYQMVRTSDERMRKLTHPKRLMHGVPTTARLVR